MGRQSCIRAGMIANWSLGSSLSSTKQKQHIDVQTSFASLQLRKTLHRVGRRENVCRVVYCRLVFRFHSYRPTPMTVVTWTGSEEYLPNRDTRALKPDGIHPSLLYSNLAFLRSSAIYKSNRWASNKPHVKSREGGLQRTLLYQLSATR